MKLIKLIEDKYGKRPWYNRLENGINKREFVIYANYYPYTEDGKVYDFAKSNKIKISIRPLGT
jgi:hypothetical protein